VPPYRAGGFNGFVDSPQYGHFLLNIAPDEIFLRNFTPDTVVPPYGAGRINSQFHRVNLPTLYVPLQGKQGKLALIFFCHPHPPQYGHFLLNIALQFHRINLPIG